MTVPVTREQREKLEAELQWVKAMTIQQLVLAGATLESAALAVREDDFSLLVRDDI